ncbi:MAG: DUF2807 domain-containing protein [Crocinitomicaceae bacterium]|nr:DUF2807 domain-containing protein [Crocinitomicaceae bacterium]
MYFRIFVIAALLMFSCKKSTERSCFKSAGEYSQIDIPISDVDSISLFKNIKYRIFQDSQNVVRVKGGENLISFVDVQNEGGMLSIANENSCNFFRKYKEEIEVEIHYPNYSRFYIEPSDSVIFMDTIRSTDLRIDLRDGGGSAILTTESNFLSIVVSNGTADYVLKGFANQAEVKVQNNGFADATGFTANDLFLYQRSTGDLKANVDGANVLLIIDGIGNVYYQGTPNTEDLNFNGSGEYLPY